MKRKAARKAPKKLTWNVDLSGKALHIAQTPGNPIRVMAGPGTGKSYALKRRLARLLEEGADPSRILVVTFTRTAAADLVQEIAALGVDGCDEISAGTLHSYCFRMLMKQAVFEFSGRTPRPLIAISKSGTLHFEAGPLLEDIGISDNFGNKRARTSRVRAFEAVWARLQHEEPGWAEDQIDARFHEALVDWMKFHNCMLIGELVPEALKFIQNNPASSVLEQFDHVLVDEYQDLNKAEQALINSLAANGSLGVVGDVDQSIYSFRHANPEGILEFHKTYANTEDHVLDECRRCPPNVVAMADSLIRRNYKAKGTPRLVAQAGKSDGEVHIVQWKSLAAEVKGIAELTRQLVEDQDYAPGDVLILCPRRLIGYQIREQLLNAGIPTHSFYHEEALETEESREAFALLTLLAHPGDRVALRYLLGCKSGTWLAKQYQKLRETVEQSGEEPWNLLENLAAGTTLLKGTSDIVARFRDIQSTLDELEGLDIEELIYNLFPENAEWAQVLREMVALCVNNLDDASQLLDHLRTSLTQPAMPEAGKFVRIMSLHKSKGLTAKAVFVCSCIDGLIPFQDDSATYAEKRRIEKEQRRLFYVALTRSTKFLALSSFTKIDTKTALQIGAKTSRRGAELQTIASPFFSELGRAAPAAIAGTKIQIGH